SSRAAHHLALRGAGRSDGRRCRRADVSVSDPVGQAMTARATFALTAFGLALLALAFVLQGAAADPVWLIPRRLMKLAAMIVGGCAVALSSISFQTVAGNRILTP